MAKDYYDILHIKHDASPEEIKRAYRELALQLHPDRNKSKDATQRFAEVNEAYAVLSDPQKRQQYDMLGPGQFNQQFTPEDIFRGFDFESILKNFGMGGAGGFGNFEEAFGFGNPGAAGQGQVQEQLNLSFPLSDMEKGIDRDLEVQHFKRCANCNGSGGEPGSKDTKCPECRGTGTVRLSNSGMGAFFVVQTTCGRCGGRGVIHEKSCRICKGRGQLLAKERFRIRIDKK